MKRNLFIILFLMVIIPIPVKGEELYVNHGQYNYSDTYIEERKDLEVEEVLQNGKTIYKYRTRDYIIIPKGLVIDRKNFNILDYIDTNLPLEDITITEYYDLDTMNKCNGAIEIKYKKAIMGFVIYINIDDYIEIPEQIIINDDNFDIWDYIDTNIETKEEISIEGAYDLSVNGEYSVIVSYDDIVKETKLIVDILKEEENEIIEEDEIKDIEVKEDITNKTVENKETITYVNNYYETKDTCKDVEYIDRFVPVNNIIKSKDKDYNKEFRYISYGFYGVITIILSIIVVRKK
ncbi:MAG: hypothetical protein IJO43_04030 [Bacilli bacterium]|nr:hypothetical protein [Bacilli bacterium]